MSNSRADHPLLLRSTFRCALAIDGGSVEDTGAVRIIGWSDGSGDTFAPGPTELTPDAVRQFVFEARSDLAIDVETKLGDR